MSVPIPAPVRGVLSFALLVANTLLWCLPVLALALVKLALPWTAVRRPLDRGLNVLATAWIACSGAIVWGRGTRWDVAGQDGLRPRDWYMVTANHQSWVDVFVLQRALGGRVPLLKFFLKQQLLYVPVIGAAWWALDFPFLRRQGKRALRRHPGARLKDRDATRRACAKFALVPTSVTTFPDGTRRTPAKQAAQATPYRHLLKPKAGSLAMSLQALGGRFRSLLDVTIVYPEGVPTFWDLLCGRCSQVVVRVRERAIEPGLHEGDYTADPAFRRRFHRWLDAVWREKDAQIDALLRAPEVAVP